MKVDMIKQPDVRLISREICYKMNYNSRLNFVHVGFIHVAYVMNVEKEKVNMCEIFKHQLIDNIDRIMKGKYTPFIFESIFKVTDDEHTLLLKLTQLKKELQEPMHDFVENLIR